MTATRGQKPTLDYQRKGEIAFALLQVLLDAEGTMTSHQFRQRIPEFASKTEGVSPEELAALALLIFGDPIRRRLDLEKPRQRRSA